MNYIAYIVYLLLQLPSVHAYLTLKPKHATVRRGSNVTLSCRSDTHDVNWRYTSLMRSVKRRRLYEHVDSNGSLHLYWVSISDTGIYRCEDMNEAAFAELQVLDSSADVSLSLCPTDVTARVGETVVLRAFQPDSNVMRWYRQLVTSHTPTKTTIYTGSEMDYKEVDDRYDIVSSRQGQKDLVIRNVTLNDAGLYTARDEIHALEASANLTVIDDLSSGIKVERELHGYKLNCSVVYRGRHRPEVSWMSALRTTVRFLRSSLVNKATHHVVSSEIFISSNDEYTLPAFCQVSVPLFRCNELSSMNTLKFPVHPIHSNGHLEAMRGGYSDVMMSEMEAVKVLIRSPNAMVLIITSVLMIIVFFCMIMKLSTSCAQRRSQRKVHTIPRPQDNETDEDSRDHFDTADEENHVQPLNDATYEKLQASQLAVYPVYERAFPVYENMGAQFDRRH